ncbi:hypothetical protein P7D22_08625 [Lichenihabitans sp. Uapishka_5]|uniref:hypothetical protein n=1 Tax=Lichenihabitans sp. Uapishka_5 TaxID=3037302 RepID=UPI0029E7EC34|nr:hypothetical protein [Lichenihabitans sp. Uapishka_5]MDX7951240.1 hypothetical protein [Lichenihabitans sp. Uapishka_5]
MGTRGGLREGGSTRSHDADPQRGKGGRHRRTAPERADLSLLAFDENPEGNAQQRRNPLPLCPAENIAA